MPKLIVRVTARHIGSGMKANKFHCPIALALKDAFPDRNIRVGLYTVWIGLSKYALSSQATKFTHRFDHDLSVEPLVLSLDPIIVFR